MDKKTLNNEIVLCRPAVRKAKVAVIRKLLKRIKILKSCKIETVKEKKLRKSERLFKKVQMMKKVKLDEVTKFALRHNDIEVFLKRQKVNLKQNALACLARNEAVMKKVNFIRGKIQNWETELPILLDSLGKKKKVVKQETANNDLKTITDSMKKQDEQLKKNMLLVKPKVRSNGRPQPIKQPSRTSNKEGSEKLEAITKIEDPFFLGKKMVAPKLLLERLPNQKNSDKLEKIEFSLLEREGNSSLFQTKSSKAERNLKDCKTQNPSTGDELEKLHPSWAAKKVKLIKPFQGKKITFSDD